jgi:glycosyltransferase involved in cell wall biosynthesis
VKVVIDARMAFHSGIGRYIRCLGQALAESSLSPELTLLTSPGDDAAWLGSNSIRKIVFDADIYSTREHWLGSLICYGQARDAEVFHFPHYNIPWLLPRRSVVTIHDLTHFKFPEFFPSSMLGPAKAVLARAVRRAGRIIVPSDATRMDLEEMFKGVSRKTVVIHHGVEPRFKPIPTSEVERFRQEKQLGRFFLYVGNNKQHKNLSRLSRAFAVLRESHPNAGLVLVGETESASPYPTGTRVLPRLSDEELVYLYNAAEAVLLPSLSEGFGLPAVEAMACGTPVIGSDINTLVEVVGEAGLLIDPRDEGALAGAMLRILDEPELVAALSRASLDRIKPLSWSRSASMTLDVYQQALAAG